MNDRQKEGVVDTLNFLLRKVRSVGGDGWGRWVSQYYTLEELLPIVHEVNDALKFPGNVEFFGEDPKCGKYPDPFISWGDNYQENITIVYDPSERGQMMDVDIKL